MTDPVDTDALRRLAHDVEHGWDTETGPSLRAAAYEVDRLRAESDDVYRDAYRLGQQHSGAEVHKQRAAALRAVIENAPHGTGCTGITVAFDDYGTPRRSFSGACTCWKADAL